MFQTRYYVKYLDVKNKWVDSTKTTVELIFQDRLGVECVLAYVHTGMDISEAKQNQDTFIDLMLKTIRGSIEI